MNGFYLAARPAGTPMMYVLPGAFSAEEKAISVRPLTSSAAEEVKCILPHGDSAGWNGKSLSKTFHNVISTWHCRPFCVNIDFKQAIGFIIGLEESRFGSEVGIVFS